MTGDLVVNFDGGGSSYGGPGGWGVVLMRDGEIVDEANGYLADATNNVAEYTALIAALTLIRKYKPTGHVTIRGDSQLVIYQVTRKYRVKNVFLIPYYDRARKLIGEMADLSFTFEWVKRTQNGRADALAGEAIRAGKATRGDLFNHVVVC